MTIHTNILLLILLVVSAVVIAQETNPKQKPAADSESPIRVRSPEERKRMEAYLAEYNDPGIINGTIDLEDGDTVDCVDIYLQHGSARRIEKLDASPPDQKEAEIRDGAEFAKQIYGKTKICPTGTIPRPHLTIDDLVRFESLEEYFQKLPGGFTEQELGKRQKRSKGPTDLHQYAVYYQSVTNWGTDSVLNLWSPYTELPTEFSLSQQWVVGGSGANRETVEAGWQVYKQKYGDYRARLFIYFTPDNYGNLGDFTTAGCYNKDCSAFVQVNSGVYIAGAFDQYSVAGGSQRTIHLRLQQAANGNWWLKYGNTWVGYWPASKFDSNGIRNGGDTVEFGGEIIDNRNLNLHTSTDMGSGYFPSAGFGYSCYQRNLRYIKGSAAAPVWGDVSGSTYVSGTQCYDEIVGFDSVSWKRYMYFGGPGYHPTNCY